MQHPEHGDNKEKQRIVRASLTKARPVSGYKSISPHLTVPLYTVHCVIKKSDKTGTIANHSGLGHKRKGDKILQQRLV